MKNYDVAVIGGGASGMACAVRLSQSGKKINIALIDAGERLGKKLAATGNGQGNVTNSDMNKGHYFGGNVSLVENIACSENNLKTESSLFHMVLCRDSEGRIYPGGRQASALVDCLLSDLKRGGVNIFTATKVTDIEKGYKLTLSTGEIIFAKYVVLCVGGKAQKQFKTDGTSYFLAEKFGHSLTPLYPSLVQLKTETEHIKSLKGIRVDCIASVMCGGQTLAKKRGDVIFTDYGVSGNAVFALSPYVVDKRNAVISLSFLPDVPETEIIKDIQTKKRLGYPRQELLSGTLHNQLGRAVIKRCNTDDENKIVHTIKNFTLQVTGNTGFDYAQVTKGGIKMTEITDELESKIAPNLFFAGEVLDVDGECGGYNLHWAFTSGVLVAETISKRI